MRDAIAPITGELSTRRARGPARCDRAPRGTRPDHLRRGEETAALEVIEGRKPWPLKKPPYPGQAGLFGKPTTVNNVETLAFVPGIVRNGRAWFGAGTMLCSLGDDFVRPGIYETPLGGPFRSVVYELGGRPRVGTV